MKHNLKKMYIVKLGGAIHQPWKIKTGVLTTHVRIQIMAMTDTFKETK